MHLDACRVTDYVFADSGEYNAGRANTLRSASEITLREYGTRSACPAVLFPVAASSRATQEPGVSSRTQKTMKH